MRKLPIILLLVVILLLAGCSGDEDDTTTTTGGGAGSATETTTLVPGGGAGSADTTITEVTTGDLGTTTTLATMPLTYDIAHRSPGDNGDLLVVLVEDVGDGVTDHDLEQLILDVVESYGPVREVHVISDPAVLELVLADAADLTDDEQAQLDAAYLLRLIDGTSVSFMGPFEDVPGYEIGS